MPGLDISLPNIKDEDFNNQKQMKQIKDYLFKLNEQLDFVLSNLDGDNFSDDTANKLNAIIGISKIMADNKSDLQLKIANATKLLTTALGGYVVKREGEILIMDTEYIDTATKIWRWNLNGLGYSSSGKDGPYELAVTMDGRICADFITTGILSSVVIMSDNYTTNENGDTVSGTMINLNNGTFNTAHFNLNGMTGEGSIAGMGISDSGLKKEYIVNGKSYIGTLDLDNSGFNLSFDCQVDSSGCGVNVYYNNNEPILNLYAKNASGLDDENIKLNGQSILVNMREIGKITSFLTQKFGYIP